MSLFIDEIRSQIDIAKQAEKDLKGTGNRCGKCHIKKAEIPSGVPKTSWTPHQCSEEWLGHTWDKCPTAYKDGKFALHMHANVHY